MSGHVRRFRAMGTDCQVTVFADASVADALLDALVERVEILEACWSRFRPDSELNRLNARAGSGAVDASDDLVELVATMRAAWSLTDGLCDPTVLASMQAMGYDADFATVVARSAIDAVDASTLRKAPGMGEVQVDEAGRTIALPAGVGIDPGAIGKGLAGDIIVDEFMDAGVDGVLVSLGGDVVLAGRPGDDPHWSIAIADERQPGEQLRTIDLDPGIDRAAIATSTTLKRRWANGRHHLVDPRTGDLGHTDLVQATVIAEYGWQAEAGATAALLLGAAGGSRWLEDNGMRGVLLTADLAVGVGHG